MMSYPVPNMESMEDHPEAESGPYDYSLFGPSMSMRGYLYTAAATAVVGGVFAASALFAPEIGAVWGGLAVLMLAVQQINKAMDRAWRASKDRTNSEVLERYHWRVGYRQAVKDGLHQRSSWEERRQEGGRQLPGMEDSAEEAFAREVEGR